MNALAAIGLLAGTAVSETVHGVVVFTRHGDRTTKHYGDQQLTPLGATQNYQVGASYRSRYLDPDSDYQIRGISPDQVKHSQIYASAPNQAILSNTATAFLQGLYPPLSESNSELVTETLNNGSDSSAPLDGYQYVLLEGKDDNSPDTIWIKGDDACPAYVNASKTFPKSDMYRQRVEDTRGFYAGFYEHLEDVYDLTPEDMTYENAYTIFDLLNVARIHNESTSALDISDGDMFQLRTLADSYEFASNYNASQPARSVGAQTLAGGILARLNETVTSQGALKFSLLSGSYDTFLAFFGVMGLTELSDDFEGLPGYASTMAFELFSDDDDDDDGDGNGNVSFPAEGDLRVRWMFKNGTEGGLMTYPLFGSGEDVLSYEEFVGEMRERGVVDVGSWCNVCSATEEFCAAYEEDSVQEEKGGGGKGLSNVVAGVTGAAVTVAVVGVAGAVVFVVMRRKRVGGVTEEKSVGSGSGSGSA